jgi:hypothetical protein
MDLLEVALQIIAIIAIVAVGAFIIVFLSDLLISIIDDHQGIFFKRNRGREEENKYTINNTRMFENNFQNEFENSSANKVEQKPMAKGFEFEFDEAPQKEEKVVEHLAKKNTIDFEAAKKEQEMIERANQNFFDEEEQEEESKEELERKERIAKLEERNRQLEEELKLKETVQQSKKFEDLAASFDEESLNEADEEEFSVGAMDDYESLIKQINQEVKVDFESKSDDETLENNFVEDEVEQQPEEETEEETEEFELEEELDELELEEETEEQEDEKYESLAQELQALKQQLEQERKEREQLTLEADERAKKLIEEKVALEEALKAKKEKENEEGAGVVVLESEEEYVERLQILEERLKEAKRQLRKNKREFVPLNKIKRTLEKDQVKLRRKEAQVAKQKVALFGVNNSDIDPAKQAELEQEIDMLEGLKLSVQHCEDVMRENADRYPVLEQTNQILTKNVKNLTSDIEAVEAKLKSLKKKKS